MSRSSQRIIAAGIGVIFLIAGMMKVLDPAAFAVDILNYRILPWTGAVALALYLPWVEIFCGAALVLHRGYRGALCIAAGLFAMFIGAYGSTRPRGLDVACGCFGHGAHRGYWPLLIGDGLLLAATLWLLKAEFRPLSPVIRAGREERAG
jgi:putative oxidoreductase